MRFLLLFIAILLPLVGKSYGNNEQIIKGKNLFATHCHACHAVHKELMGPQLSSITKKRPEIWLLKFIRNSQKVIVSGDKYANFLYKQYHNVTMPSFEQLSRQDVQAILAFIENASKEKKPDYVIFQKEVEKTALNSQMKGQKIFQNHCSSCHAIDREIYGPALGSVSKARPSVWLYNFIQHSQKLVKAGDPEATFLFKSFEHKEMPAFYYLSKEDIDAILEYIQIKSSSPSYVAGINGKYPAISKHGSLFTMKPKHYEEGNAGIGIIFKIFLVLVIVGTAIVHVILFYKLFVYLRGSNKFL